jgi:TonB-dependent SusC/RagA subfamily outer membrane receptor
MRQDDIRADDTELLMNLEGKVVNRRQQPLPEKVVTAISVTGRDPYLALDTTDGTGNFKLPLPIYRDSLVLKIEVKNKHDRNEDDNIQVNYFKFPQFSTPVALKRHYFQQQESFVKNLNRYHTDTVFAGIGKEWLTPVIVKTYVKPKALTGYDESKRVNSFSFILNQEKLKQYGAGSIGNALLMIPGISYKQGQLAMYGGDGWMDSTHLSEPLLVLDGVRMPKNMLGAGDTASTLHESPTMAFLNAFTYQDIDFIEVLRGPEASIYGADGGDGVILVNTKTHQADESLAGAYKIIKPVTYNLPPKFVMPDYFLKQVKNSKAPDPRTTIYWNADVVTGADGIASVNFFTADDATTYTVTITGLTANGDFVYKRITLNRK